MAAAPWAFTTRMNAREMVEELLGYIASGRTDLAAGMFAEYIDFEIPHHDDIWWIPDVRTRDDFASFLSGLGDELETLRFEVDVIATDGDDVVIVGVIEDRVRRTGRSFTSPFSLALRVNQGVFTRYHFLEDSAAVMSAATDE